nr:MAG TPA: hypothetical protein [Caudoviricetes sp.]
MAHHVQCGSLQTSCCFLQVEVSCFTLLKIHHS